MAISPFVLSAHVLAVHSGTASIQGRVQPCRSCWTTEYRNWKPVSTISRSRAEPTISLFKILINIILAALLPHRVSRMRFIHISYANVTKLKFPVVPAVQVVVIGRGAPGRQPLVLVKQHHHQAVSLSLNRYLRLVKWCMSSSPAMFSSQLIILSSPGSTLSFQISIAAAFLLMSKASMRCSCAHVSWVIKLAQPLPSWMHFIYGRCTFLQHWVLPMAWMKACCYGVRKTTYRKTFPVPTHSELFMWCKPKSYCRTISLNMVEFSKAIIMQIPHLLFLSRLAATMCASHGHQTQVHLSLRPSGILVLPRLKITRIQVHFFCHCIALLVADCVSMQELCCDPYDTHSCIADLLYHQGSHGRRSCSPFGGNEKTAF